MPYTITPLKNGRYKVTSPNGTKSAHATKANAVKQVRLLNAIEHNKNFKPKKK